jgi:hypothetical protein
MTIPDYDICDCGIRGVHFKCRPPWPDSHITKDKNNPNRWIAWDETQANKIGSYPSREAARKAIIAYTKTLHEGSSELQFQPEYFSGHYLTVGQIKEYLATVPAETKVYVKTGKDEQGRSACSPIISIQHLITPPNKPPIIMLTHRDCI